MECRTCIHERVCKNEDRVLDPLANCDLYRPVGRTTVILDYCDLEALLDCLDNAKGKLKQIRKSHDRDSVEFWLERCVKILKVK